MLLICFVIGCSNNDEGSQPSTKTVSFSGIVADGYIKGATVCFDKNDNGICDDGNYRITEAGGKYTFGDTLSLGLRKKLEGTGSIIFLNNMQ